MRSPVCPSAVFLKLLSSCCLAATILYQFIQTLGTVLDPRSVNSLFPRAALGRWEIGAFSCRSGVSGSFGAWVLPQHPGSEPACSVSAGGLGQQCFAQSGLNREVAEQTMKAQIPDWYSFFTCHPLSRKTGDG